MLQNTESLGAAATANVTCQFKVVKLNSVITLLSGVMSKRGWRFLFRVAAFLTAIPIPISISISIPGLTITKLREHNPKDMSMDRSQSA